jgi:serine phosphatase RsbU (regulator of sigma subunit)
MFPPYPERVISPPAFIGYGKSPPSHDVFGEWCGNTISMRVQTGQRERPGQTYDGSMALTLDMGIQTPDWPGQMATILAELKQLRESNALLKKRQTEIEAELSLASRVQQSLAPRSLVWNDLSVETHYSPAHTIGGDFGIVFPHNEEVLTILLCDVSGHGIGSALIANRMYSEALHQLERQATPSTLLRHLHDFAQVATDGFYFTMAAVRFSTQGHQATFVGGGHPPTMHVSNGRVRLLESQNGILGCLSETAKLASAEDIELAPGDRLVLYTDGLVEVFDSTDDMLGVEGLKALILQSANRPLSEMRRAILNGVAAWRHGPLRDDVSLVIVEIR